MVGLLLGELVKAKSGKGEPEGSRSGDLGVQSSVLVI